MLIFTEIDLIVDRKMCHDLIEIKKSATFKPAMIRTLTSYRREQDKAYLVYQGEEDQYQDVAILSFQKYLELTS